MKHKYRILNKINIICLQAGIVSAIASIFYSFKRLVKRGEQYWM